MRQKKILIAVTSLIVLFGCAAFLNFNITTPAVGAKSVYVPMPTPQATPTSSPNDSKIVACPAPKPGAIYALCGYTKTGTTVENQTPNIAYKVERQLWKMSCADENLSLEEAKKKIQVMWFKYKDTILCDSSDIEGEKVSLPIYAMQESFSSLHYLFIEKYDLDIESSINGQTLLEYLDERAIYLENQGGFEQKAQSLKNYKKEIQKSIAEKKAKQAKGTK